MQICFVINIFISPVKKAHSTKSIHIEIVECSILRMFKITPIPMFVFRLKTVITRAKLDCFSTDHFKLLRSKCFGSHKTASLACSHKRSIHLFRLNFISFRVLFERRYNVVPYNIQKIMVIIGSVNFNSNFRKIYCIINS